MGQLARDNATMNRRAFRYFLTSSALGAITYVDENGDTQTLTGNILLPHMQAVYITTGAATTVYLPDVSVMEGKVVTITAVSQGSGDLTVADQNESYDWADETLGDDADGTCLYSDGYKWWVLTDNFT